jgi:hypothetical protein
VVIDANDEQFNKTNCKRFGITYEFPLIETDKEEDFDFIATD